MDDYLAQFKKMLDCRNLSPHTRDQYASTITQFLDYFDTQLHKDPASFEWGEIRAFFDRLKATKNLSDRTINSDIAHLENFIIYVALSLFLWDGPLLTSAQSPGSGFSSGAQ